MRIRAVMFFVCSVLLAFGACKPRFTNENLAVVNREFEFAEEQNHRGIKDNGVSPKEVESILGPPQKIETAKLPLETQKKELEVVRYYYQQDGQTLQLHFIDNKLISKVPLLGTEQPSKAKP